MNTQEEAVFEINNPTAYEAMCDAAEAALPSILKEGHKGETTTLLGLMLECREEGFRGGLATAEMRDKHKTNVLTFNDDGTVVINGSYYEKTRPPVVALKDETLLGWLKPVIGIGLTDEEMDSTKDLLREVTTQINSHFGV